jgi:choline-glycine betaine transporter
MRAILLISLLFTLHYSSIFGQYKVEEKLETLCQEPECVEVRTRSLSKKDIIFQYNIYQISSHNAVLFIPDAFIPKVSALQITGAVKYISKIQIYTIKDNKLIF